MKTTAAPAATRAWRGSSRSTLVRERRSMRKTQTVARIWMGCPHPPCSLPGGCLYDGAPVVLIDDGYRVRDAWDQEENSRGFITRSLDALTALARVALGKPLVQVCEVGNFPTHAPGATNRPRERHRGDGWPQGLSVGPSAFSSGGCTGPAWAEAPPAVLAPHKFVSFVDPTQERRGRIERPKKASR